MSDLLTSLFAAALMPKLTPGSDIRTYAFIAIGTAQQAVTVIRAIAEEDRPEAAAFRRLLAPVAVPAIVEAAIADAMESAQQVGRAALRDLLIEAASELSAIADSERRASRVYAGGVANIGSCEDLAERLIAAERALADEATP
jgi:hypothetical protein